MFGEVLCRFGAHYCWERGLFQRLCVSLLVHSGFFNSGFYRGTCYTLDFLKASKHFIINFK